MKADEMFRVWFAAYTGRWAEDPLCEAEEWTREVAKNVEICARVYRQFVVMEMALEEIRRGVPALRAERARVAK